MGLSYETPPAVSMVRALVRAGRGGPIPRIEASARALPGESSAYATLCGFPSGGSLPLTWPNVLVRGLQLAVMTAPEFPLRLAGVVHTAQQITRLRHISPSEPLNGACWVEGHRPARSGGEFDLHAVVRSGDEEVWRSVTTILSRALPGDGVKRAPAEEPAFKVRRSVCWRLPADLGRRYAAVSGDYNPIHLSPWTSRPFGFARPIAHGWWTLARALAELDEDVPESVTVNARFRAPVPLPGAVAFQSGPSASGHRFTVSRGGKLAVSGEVTPAGS